MARGVAAGVALPLLNSARTSSGLLGRASRGLTARLQSDGERSAFSS